MTASSNLDVQRERAARNQALFREVNERIENLNKEFGDDEETPHYVCECLDPSCAELIALPRNEYERIRRYPADFFVVPGHEQPHVEEVVDAHARWVVVRKLGVGGAVAEELAGAA